MSPATRWWAPRLIVALLISLALHGLPIGLGRQLGTAQPLDLDLDMEVHTVEIGLEYVQPGALHPPPPAPAPAPPPVAPPAPPRNATAPHHVAATPRAPRPEPAHRETTPNGDPIDSLPELLHPRLQPPEIRRAEISHRINDDTLALRSPDHANPRDAGTDAGASATNALDTIPTIAAATGDVAPLVPRGSLLTVTVRTDRVRDNPNARALGEVFRSIPDWQDMLGGSNLDPVRDLDSITLAAAQPFGTNTQAPDWFVLARGAQNNDVALRRAIEQMARSSVAPAPSPVAPGYRDGGNGDATFASASVLPEAGMSADADLDATAEPDSEPMAMYPGDGGAIWQSNDAGYAIATFQRYYAQRSFVMLGDGLAAIAMPGQVDALLSAMARRGPPQVDATDPRLLALVEANGLRNLVEFDTWHGPFPVPSRASLALYAEEDEEGRQSGSTVLVSRWQYDNHAQAEHARQEMEYSRGRWHVLIAASFGNQGGVGRFLTGLVASGVVGVDINALERAIDALQFDTEGDKLRVRGTFTRDQVRSVLNLLSARSRLNLDALGSQPP